MTNPGDQTDIVGTNIELAIGAPSERDTLIAPRASRRGYRSTPGHGVIIGTVSTTGPSTVTVSDGRGGTASTGFSPPINDRRASRNQLGLAPRREHILLSVHPVAPGGATPAPSPRRPWKGVRGKYFSSYQKGSNLVLNPDVAKSVSDLRCCQ